MTKLAPASIRGLADEINHGATHISEAREAILDAYHAGQDMPEDDAMRMVWTLNAIITHANQVRTALLVMGKGGLQETGSEQWYASDGSTDTGPFDTLAEALAEVRERAEDEFDPEIFMAYEANDPDA